MGLIPGSGRFPWRRKWLPTPVFLPGKPHGQKRLEGYSPTVAQSQTRWRTHVFIISTPSKHPRELLLPSQEKAPGLPKDHPGGLSLTFLLLWSIFSTSTQCSNDLKQSRLQHNELAFRAPAAFSVMIIINSTPLAIGRRGTSPDPSREGTAGSGAC